MKNREENLQHYFILDYLSQLYIPDFANKKRLHSKEFIGKRQISIVNPSRRIIFYFVIISVRADPGKAAVESAEADAQGFSRPPLPLGVISKGFQGLADPFQFCLCEGFLVDTRGVSCLSNGGGEIGSFDGPAADQVHNILNHVLEFSYIA